MSRKTAAVALSFVAAVCWAGVSARQSQSVPGPGSGVATVRGSVDVSNTVPVAQSGAWKVDVATLPEVRVGNRPTVYVATPEFVRPGGQYTITWSDGSQESMSITQFSAAGWVKVTTPDNRSRWINIALARAIAER